MPIDTPAAPVRHPRGILGLASTSGELLQLDLVRFIASAGIVLCHSAEFFVPRAQRIASHAHTGALALFVDVFFVISGFVIAHVYGGKIASLAQYGRFMQRRIGRLYPLHLATMLAYAVLFLMIARLGVATNTDMRLIPQCLVTGALLIHAAVGCGGSVPNGVNWSISAEMFMYWSFPLQMWLAARAGVLRYALWLAILAAVIMLNGTAIGWTESTSLWRAVPAFFLGIALRIDWKHWARLPVPVYLPALLSVLLLAGSLLLVSHWILLALAYAIAISAVAADGAGRVSAAVRRYAPLGQLTYSMYMLHPIVLTVLVNAIGDKILKLGVPALSGLTLLSYVIILGLSLFSYKWFETPARRFIDGLKLFPTSKAREEQSHV